MANQHPGPRPLAIAHRAGNDLAQLAAAEQAGVDLVEADVWRYRGRLEVRHLKTLGPLPILWDRWKLAPGWKRRLGFDELVGAIGPNTELLIDLKGRDGRLPADVAETMARRAPGRRYAVTSRNWSLIEPFRGRPGVTVFHSVGSRGELRAALRRFAGPGDYAISVHQRLLSAAVLGEVRRVASTVITWPIDERRRMAELIEWGVDGMTSDSVDLLRELVRAREAGELGRFGGSGGRS